MTKKITKQQLEKIIVEEIENYFINEGVFSQIGAGLKNVVKQAGSNYKSGVFAKKQQEEEAKQLNKNLEAISDFLQMYRSDRQIKELIKGTKIGKELLGLKEQYQSQLLQLLKSKQIAPQDVREFLQAVSANPNAQKFFNAMGVDLPAQPAAASTPEQPAAASTPEQPAAPPSAKSAETEVGPDISGEPEKIQGPPEPPVSSEIPQPVGKKIDNIVKKTNKNKVKVKKPPIKSDVEKAITQPKRKLASLESQIEAAKTKDSLEAMKEKIMKIKDPEIQIPLGVLYQKKSEELEKKRKRRSKIKRGYT